MYNDFFGLKEAPFSIAPNPYYLYMSDRHREALAHLLYGIRGDGGFILLTGEVGTGKTTVSRCLLGQIPDDVDVAFILNPKLTAVELLAAACDDLGIVYPANASIKIMVDHLNKFLLKSHQDGRRTVLIIDEAQNLSVDVLEQLRLLTNLETNQRKLLQIILLGQPELLTILQRDDLRQLSQRVTARFHLGELNRLEVHEYIKHRLAVAGAMQSIFPKKVMDKIYRISHGIPRVINLICDRALLGAFSENKQVLDNRIVEKAAREVLGSTKKQSPQRFWHYLVPLLVVIITLLSLQYYFPWPALEESLVSIETPSTLPVAPEANNLAATNSIATEIKGHANLLQAFTDLFALWGVAFEQVSDEPCTQAAQIGLKCRSNLGSIEDIKRLDRPAILYLQGQWVTLSQIHNGLATLIASDKQTEISVKQLFDDWDGRYTIFWRMPPGYQGPVAIGDEGATVDWLANQFASLDAVPLSSTTGYRFDASLESRLKKFQLSQGIVPNGVAGVETWIRLNSLLGVNIPKISTEQI